MCIEFPCVLSELIYTYALNEYHLVTMHVNPNSKHFTYRIYQLVSIELVDFIFVKNTY